MISRSSRDNDDDDDTYDDDDNGGGGSGDDDLNVSVGTIDSYDFRCTASMFL